MGTPAPFRCGFETIGNATILVYDQGMPLLATDPWIEGSSYFGSWTLSHEIPPAQMQAARQAPFVWFSHGHPDHLNPESLPLFLGRTILLPDHRGQRIHDDLERMGHTVKVLPQKEWVTLSPHVRVQCLSDYYQDAILLIDVGGRLLVNTNDAIDRGWGRHVRRVIKEFDKSFLLALIGYGDADMINYYREDGSFIVPKAGLKLPVGRMVKQSAESYGVTHYIPFSTMHKYQRADSLWAHEYTTPISDFATGFESKTVELLPAFTRWNCENDEHYPIDPRPNDGRVFAPIEFGDDWGDVLSADDQIQCRAYFQRVEHLATWLDSVVLRVGANDFEIPLGRGHDRSLRFDVPRNSLMTAVEYRIFDDLLIGNFMKTTLIGTWPRSGLYPDFTPYVARYSDQAEANTREELDEYFEAYRQRDPMEFWRHRMEMKAIDFFRSSVAGDSPIYSRAKAVYWALKRAV
ncbi:hypothetical protein J2X06_001118 [Lysobacter niastensis]|uniref:MBL fold metallo-hydrolase n=1 Tax=Lysobacter niastensis TaxID=380629 RepID=A0ABU1W8K8_9GAMM|nr:hypothetical protein [Lysobacter niastensis]MDR7133934.1 hypothetical protein [Lysobacter niastensis]